MDKETAKRVVRETFSAAFDQRRYRDFANELLNGFDQSHAKTLSVSAAFSPHVKGCLRLGTYTSPEEELVDVLVVELTESYKLERSRTSLRNFVAHQLKRGDNYKEAALVAFVAPDSKSWRFSFVRMDYATKRDPETGKIRAEEQFTPARRYSYLVGPEEQSHTAQSQFLAFLQNTSDRPTLSRLEEAFSVEAVTKEFFHEYARLFEDTEAALAQLVKRDKILRQDFVSKRVKTADFAKKLLGQIVFLYFIQKKGWLGVTKEGKWGDGPHNFMRLVANRAATERESLFNQVLEPLFYDTLATDRGHEAWSPMFQSRIPFLNGGLFEPLAGYDWQNTDILLPNELFANSEMAATGDVGTGILDVFDRYNFTVKEDEPLEKEVAVDPEMLGKVFENLIEENPRKGLGAFYTPREIVHFMCQESLINYLDSALNHPVKPIGAPPPQLEEQHPLFIDSSEKRSLKPAQREFTETDTRVLVERKDLEEWMAQSDQFVHYAPPIAAASRGDGYPKPPESIRKFAREIDTLLRDILVCDPAIGSGAFPVGMMTEIVRARTALTPYFNDVADRTAYWFKRQIIQHSLYGVDIDPGAVEIARLRLWLSLVVDEEEVLHIKPLPNLDYKIVVGNSLLVFPFTSHRAQRIESLKADFFDETDHDKKAKLRAEIDLELSTAFANSKRSLGYEVTFDFATYFSEVFRSNNGFDVVIANPPYVRHEAIKNLKPALKSLYECFTGTADLLVYFYERGVKLLAPGGSISFITSNKFYRAAYGQKIRSFLTRELTLDRLIDFGDAPVFEAVAYASILTGVRALPRSDSTAVCYTWEKGMPLDRIAQIIDERGQSIRQAELKPNGWQLEAPATLRLLEKLLGAGTPLAEYVDGPIYSGIKTGLNEAFVVDRGTRDRLIREHKSSAEILKPFLRGRDVKRWSVQFDDHYLIRIESSENERHPWSGKSEIEAEKSFASTYPAIYRRFQSLRDIKLDKPDARGCRNMFEQLQRRDDQGKYYWELRSCVYWNEFEKPKILYPDIYEHQSFTWDVDKYFTANTCYFIRTDERWLTGLLNSATVEWFYGMLSNRVRGGYLRAFSDYMRQIPIPRASPEVQEQLETLVNRALAAKAKDPSADTGPIEREIDLLVYELYGLTADERNLVTATVK